MSSKQVQYSLQCPVDLRTAVRAGFIRPLYDDFKKNVLLLPNGDKYKTSYMGASSPVRDYIVHFYVYIGEDTLIVSVAPTYCKHRGQWKIPKWSVCQETSS